MKQTKRTLKNHLAMELRAIRTLRQGERRDGDQGGPRGGAHLYGGQTQRRMLARAP